MVPGSTLIYGSSFISETETPRLFSSLPREATVMPLPTDDTTPPLTKMYRVTSAPSKDQARHQAMALASASWPQKEGTGTPVGVPVHRAGGKAARSWRPRLFGFSRSSSRVDHTFDY